jgi:hypothetical protein
MYRLTCTSQEPNHRNPDFSTLHRKKLSFKGAFRLETKSFPQAVASISWHLQKIPHHLEEQTMLKLFLRPDPQTNPKGFAISEIE